MLADSIDLGAAAALFAAAVGAWWLSAPLRSRERLYLRFAAVLLAALAASVPFDLADVTVLFLLPLAAGALMVCALAGVLPVGLAALFLVLALAGGLAALVTGLWPLALLPVLLAGLVVMAAAINSLALRLSHHVAFRIDQPFLPLEAVLIDRSLSRPDARDAQLSAIFCV